MSPLSFLLLCITVLRMEVRIVLCFLWTDTHALGVWHWVGAIASGLFGLCFLQWNLCPMSEVR